MKKIFTIFVLLACIFSFNHVNTNIKPSIEVTQVQKLPRGYAAQCRGKDANGNIWVGYSYGYNTVQGAVNRARHECAKAGGIYNQLWNFWFIP